MATMYDKRNMELLPHILFRKNEQLFSTMLQYRLNQDGLNCEMCSDRMMRAHVIGGSGIFFKRIERLEDFEKLLGVT